MRSLIIIEVEHDDTTDPVQDFVQSATFLDTPKRFDLAVRDYAVRVDLPARFYMNHLDSLIPTFDTP